MGWSLWDFSENTEERGWKPIPPERRGLVWLDHEEGLSELYGIAVFDEAIFDGA